MNTAKRWAPNTQRQRGYSLLEILIAVLVLSIGLLGLAGLQTTSLQSNQSAAQVSQATFLAQDILDRMRANPGAARQGNYDIGFGTSSSDMGNSPLARADLREWLQQMEAALPGTTGDGCNGDCGAAIQVNGDGRAEITLRWVDERRPEDDDQRVTSFRTVSRI
ncbi:type IV pilus modification protein PilV [Aquisalimonas sp. 2447]|uniref:type IV pilus modification protein PilV n=1 Tax=Aquisalimonas sp. 2447 TaxID=2740807 RepID=UPI0014327B61|nr:type IV pilus modification protein PilV [Aquisalimonas sp. 2447]QIT56615.1 type IV pilus modification protein PilV [Aquisalimonas sp. 2447]